MSLRLGCALCQVHTCQCGASVDTLGSHAWSCKRNAGRIQRHAFINDLIYRTMIRAGIPALKEPQGLVRVDGKRPDRWPYFGAMAVWTQRHLGRNRCRHASHVIHHSVSHQCRQCCRSCSFKKNSEIQYAEPQLPLLPSGYCPLSVNSQLFICELGRRTALRTSDPRETAFLFQRISVAIQRFNAVCLANTFVLSD